MDKKNKLGIFTVKSNFTSLVRNKDTGEETKTIKKYLKNEKVILTHNEACYDDNGLFEGMGAVLAYNGEFVSKEEKEVKKTVQANNTETDKNKSKSAGRPSKKV